MNRPTKKSRKRDEVDSGDDEFHNDAQAEGALKLEQCFQQRDPVLLRFPGAEWLLPRDVLCRDSGFFHQLLLGSEDKTVNINLVGAPIMSLYIQWLLTGRYYEFTGFAQAPSYHTACNTHTLDNIDDVHQVHIEAGVMAWCVKAAILAWKLGQHLGSPKFQNHAMTRLFAAYTRPQPRFLLDGSFLQWTREIGFMVGEFFEDLVIRNWGDESVIDAAHASWSLLIKENEKFRDAFIKAVAIPLKRRAAQPMEMEKYMLPEE